MIGAPRDRKCRTCRQPFRPANSLQRACSVACAIEQGRRQTKRSQDLARRAQRRETAERKAKLMTRRDWVKKAQAAVNRYVRARDFGKPCISCGGLPAQKFGGTMDCGHYRGTGSAPHLRFYTLQMAAQCVECNRHRSGNPIGYRVGLVGRYGVAHVERVESMQERAKWTVERLQRLASLMRKKARRLEKRRAM